MEQSLGYKFLLPDPKAEVYYRPLHFQYESYANFIKHRLKDILTVRRTLLTFKNGTESIVLEIDDVKISAPDFSPIVASIKGQSYEALVTFTVNIYRQVMTKEGLSVTKINSYEGTDSHLIKLPLLIGYGNKNALDPSKYVVPNSIGGVFINKQSIEKLGINMIDKITTWPKFREVKPNSFTLSFSSISPSHVVPARYRHYKILLDVNQPDNFVISSAKTFISVNVIVMVQFLTDVSLEFVARNLCFDMPPQAAHLAAALVESARAVPTGGDIPAYVDALIAAEHAKQKSPLSREEFRYEMLSNFLPHMQDSPNQLKGLYLLSLVRKMVYCVFFPDRYPDRDSLVCHRVYTYGRYFEALAMDELETYIGNIRNDILANHKNRGTCTVNIHVLTTPGFNHAYAALLSGKFRKSDGSFRTHPHYSWMQSISIPRSVGFYPEQVKISKMFKVRKYHPSQYGYFCASDVPERGPQVGLISQLAVLTSISNIRTADFVALTKSVCDYVRSYPPRDISFFETGFAVTVENALVASLNPAVVDAFVLDLRRRKRLGLFGGNREISVALVRDRINEVRINFGAGRLIRPLLVVENGVLLMDEEMARLEREAPGMTFSDVQREFPHVIEMVDVEQFSFSNVCDSVQRFRTLPPEERALYDFCDFPAEFRDGYVASALVGINHNSAPRAILGCAQAKQAISCLSADLRNKVDNGIHLMFPERPIVVSKALETSKIADNCFGQHVTIALMSFRGMNQEDGIILKRQFAERGGLDILTCKKYQVEIPLENFNNRERVRSAAYCKIDVNGVVRLNAFLEHGDAIARNVSSRTLDDDFVADNQISFDIAERYSDIYAARVERVQADLTDKVKVRALTVRERRAILGDKFTTRTSQKGTVAYVADESELPYDEDGVTPDVIINSTSIFSRKTLSMLMEVILTTAYGQKPFAEDGSNRPICFPSTNETDFETYIEFARRCYARAHPEAAVAGGAGDGDGGLGAEAESSVFCERVLFDPETDEPFAARVFFGPLYYLRLRHLTLDKATVRCRGRKTKLIRQANEGRKRGGGIKVGEMERDCMVSHGAAFTVTEILRDSEEDSQEVLVCENCGDIAARLNGTHVCIRCSKMSLSPVLTRMDSTHVSKVFTTQMNARGVKIRVEFEKHDPCFYASPTALSLEPDEALFSTED
ncbi:putative RNA polymerase subunit RPO132 [Parapoxvirus red deer/HL953]|uniref:DNA-directed RNA polymerase n=1 Tax=Parapoxvirus red deer/HL953 TaxID=1579460 RepID=A0A0A7MC68_9POXV|nr:putative RNA polymerase subunit RPO132 [Parapoxvirus red deer/HL953]AIZ77352.1 putative RNA polymerase subunit RPO132 [Parapoxvirus red deer/HL953]